MHSSSSSGSSNTSGAPGAGGQQQDYVDKGRLSFHRSQDREDEEDGRAMANEFLSSLAGLGQAEKSMGMQQNTAMNEKITDAGRGFVCSQYLYEVCCCGRTKANECYSMRRKLVARSTLRSLTRDVLCCAGGHGP